MKLAHTILQKAIALSLIYSIALPSYAALGLINVPPQAVVPPTPNVIVTLDDSGSMNDIVTFDPSIVYAIPPNFDGLPRGNAGGQPLAYGNGYADPINDPGNIDNLSTGAGGVPNWVKNAFNALPLADRQNYANWYSFYFNRNKAMKAAASLSFNINVIPEGRLRLAWQQLGGGCNSFNNSSGCTNNRLKSLEGSHRANFFSWVRSVPANTNTPLREAYTRVGEYMKTTGQSGAYAHDPGTTEFPVLACRRSYHVMFTDGGWNDGGSYGNADNNSVALPDNAQYTGQAPYKGASGSAGSDSLADVAFKYWATDLQPSVANSVFPTIKKGGPETYGTTIVAPYWNPKNDPATWQHLSLYAIGYGEAADLNPAAVGSNSATVPTFVDNTTGGPSFAEIVSGTRNWPTVNDFGLRAFDLWHAAVNSRGNMFPAKTPDEAVNAFKVIVAEILAGNAPTGGGSSSTALTPDFVAVQSGYEGTPTWRGVVRGYGQTAEAINVVPSFEAHSLLTAQSASSRTVLTASGPKSGVAFRWTALSTFEKDMLDRAPGSLTDSQGSRRVDYLRGDRTQERPATGAVPVPEFRGRGDNILGTIVNSEPRVIGRPRSGFVDGSYKTFRDLHANREKMIYVGANDGMLHAFSGATGASKLSYVPRGVYARLSDYADVNYVHKFFVDGPIIPGDAFVDGAWKTFLIGGLGAGGRGFYGLDITDPTAFSETNASSIVKFDYTAPSEALPASASGALATESGTNTLMAETKTDLGHIMGDAVRDANLGRSMQIAKMPNGRWAFITGNGVNSVNERPVLYIVYLDAAGGFQKIIADGATGQNNGLSAPLPVDLDGDGTVNTIYAGDLKGRMWKFVSDASGTFSLGNGGTPLMNVGKAITSAPAATIHPRGGVFLAFGTGRLVTVPDKTDTSVQTLYGVWDKPGLTGTVPITSLAVRTLSGAVTSASGTLVRTLTGTRINYNAQRGWKMDLTLSGERIVYNPLTSGSNVFFSTLIPIEGQACSQGGESGSLLAFNMISGNAPINPPFDLNSDGKFNNLDQVNSAASAANTVAGLASGIGKLSAVLTAGRGGAGSSKTCRPLGSSGSKATNCAEGPGRLAWRDLTP
jgi:type IV pilus assembly protein PilY1